MPPKENEKDRDKRSSKRGKGGPNPVHIDDQTIYDKDLTRSPSKKTRSENTATGSKRTTAGSHQPSDYEAGEGDSPDGRQRETATTVLEPDPFDAVPSSERAEQLASPTSLRQTSVTNSPTAGEHGVPARRGSGWNAINLPPFREFVAPQRRRSTFNDQRAQPSHHEEASSRRLSAVNVTTSRGGQEQVPPARRGSVWTAINTPRDQSIQREMAPSLRDSDRNALYVPGSHGIVERQEEGFQSRTDPQQRSPTRGESPNPGNRNFSASREDSGLQENDLIHQNAVDINNIWDATPSPGNDTTAASVSKGKRKAQDTNPSDSNSESSSKKPRKEVPTPKRKAKGSGDDPRPMKKNRKEAAPQDPGDDGNGRGSSDEGRDRNGPSGDKGNSSSSDSSSLSDEGETTSSEKRGNSNAGVSSRPKKTIHKTSEAEDASQTARTQRRGAFGNYEWGTPKKTTEEEFADMARMAAEPVQRPRTATEAQLPAKRATRAKTRALTQEPNDSHRAKEVATDKKTSSEKMIGSKTSAYSKATSRAASQAPKRAPSRATTPVTSRAPNQARSQAPVGRVTRSQSRGLVHADEEDQTTQEQLGPLDEEEEPGEGNQSLLSAHQQAQVPVLESIEAPLANLAHPRRESASGPSHLDEPPADVSGNARWPEPPLTQNDGDEDMARPAQGASTDGPETLHDGVQHTSMNLGKPPRKVKPLNVHGNTLTKRPTQMLSVFVCGDNRLGQLGLGGSIAEERNPVPNKELKRIVDFDCGATHCIALTRDGRVLTWGLGTADNGALGTSYVNEEGTVSRKEPRKTTREENMVPLEVDLKHLDPVNVTQVIATNDASFALTEDGRVLGWGTFMRQDENYQPYIAGLRRKDQIEHRPIHLKGWEGIIRLAGGGQHILALDSHNVMYSMGSNLYGQLGLMAERNPRPGAHPDEQGSLRRRKCDTLKGGSKPAKIACGENTSFAIDKKGMLYAWGEDTRGQLGRGSVGLPQRRPEMRTVWYSGGRKVAKLQNVVSVDSGAAHTLACTKNGKVYSWGHMAHGALGLNEAGSGSETASFEGSTLPQVVKRPTEILDLEGIENIGVGSHHSIIMDNDGLAYTFGNSGSFQTGQGYNSEHDGPEWPRQPQELQSGGIEKMKVMRAAGGEKFTIFGCVRKTKSVSKPQPDKGSQNKTEPKKKPLRKR